MSDQSYRRPLLLALAGAVIITASYYTFSQRASIRTQPTSKQTGSLHRSNAVRRPRARRRWRSGFGGAFPPQFNPLQGALEDLDLASDGRPPYGVYKNTFFAEMENNLIPIEMDLLPDNLQLIYETFVQRSPYELTPLQRDSLRLHIHGSFVQAFLSVEYPEGYIIGDDAHDIARAMVLHGVIEEVVFEVCKAFDRGLIRFDANWSPPDNIASSPTVQPVHHDGAADQELNPHEALHALADRTMDADNGSEMSSVNNDDEPEGSQNMLDLLYHIAGEQARREGYIHRGVECNICGVHPIQGIRYHCANCFDFDLCENCEAGNPHTKSHVFYKIRIPAPSRGNIKQVAKSWYPGKPGAFLNSLPKDVSNPLLLETGIDRIEMDALYDQFKCLAGTYWAEDPTKFRYAIDRKAFDAYFIPTTFDKPSPANLIYDRIFAFYDTNNDGLIGFEEFIRGLAELQKKGRLSRLSRIFEGYDLDADGYVDRRDFLRMFRAFYCLTKELSREMINNQEDFGYVEEEIHEVVQGSQPISAAFGGGRLHGHESRTGQGKQRNPEGDLVISDGSTGVLQPDSDMHGNRARAIGNAALRDRTRHPSFRSFRRSEAEDEPLFNVPGNHSMMHAGFEECDSGSEADLSGQDRPLQTYGWPPSEVPLPEDVISALGQEVALEDITDPIDRSRVLFAQARRLDAEFDADSEMIRTMALTDRWQRRQFYLDEEEGLTKPPGYTEPDSSDDEADAPSSYKKPLPTKTSPRRRSMQSRSSSKVRFDDSAIDTDYETRSNASSRSIPMNERWGGLELGQAEVDVGKDILYQAVQQGFNELLDHLFKDKEDEWMMACRTRNDRFRHRAAINDYKKALEAKEATKEAALVEADKLRTAELFAGTGPSAEKPEEIDEESTNGETQEMESAKPESAIIEAADLDDHIALMFGDQTSHATDTKPNKDDAESNSSYHDPTLPQFRPDEEDRTIHKPITEKAHNPFAGDPEAAQQLFELWSRHDAVEDEFQRRGGYGRLDFHEFRRKMVSEEEAVQASGSKGKGVEREENEDIWESSADLGRLAFIGTWLEMASF